MNLAKILSGEIWEPTKSGQDLVGTLYSEEKDAIQSTLKMVEM